MQKFKVKQWFKSLFDFESLSRSKHPRAGRLSVEPLEVRLTPDAKILPAFQNLGMGMTENKSASDSIALIDDISYQQNLPDCRASQIFLCSNDSPDHFPLQPVNKFDAIAMQAASTKGVVLIDSSLVATIPADELKGSLVVSIYGNRDVISQVTTALEGLSNVPVLRIISHGSDGVLWFGNQAFDSADLTSSAMQVASWGKSLATDADILLYGCSVANTDAGKAFVNRLAFLTDADVAASSNTTGMGGDEVFEFQVGKVSNSIIAGAMDYDSANLTLAQFTVNTIADSGAGSLRQAITDANLTSANDEIIFASSLFTNGANTITLGSAALPTIAATSSAGSLTISGPGASSLIISGDNGNTSRNFSVFNIASGGNLSISGVTVSGAKTTSNGGGFSNLGTLSVTNSLISGNTAAGGGGIYSRGILTVNNSIFSGNSTTSQNGGAVWNYGGSANSNIFNSTISSNTATTSSGGGISNTGGAVTLSNSTLFGNQAAAGGGIFNNANGTFTIFNSTISHNSATNNGGGIHVGSGTLNISNTIIANSLSGGDFYSAGSMGTNSNNLVEDGSLPGNSELTGDPLLGPLQNNGGSTFTMALGVGSIAIGAGNANTTNASSVNGLDQRGAARSLTTPSIGAFEYKGNYLYNILQTTTIGYDYNAWDFQDNSEKLAQRFLTQADASVITDIKLNIWTGLQNPGTYTVKIYSDNSGSVGTNVATVGTRDILSIYYPSGTINPVVFSGLNIRLTPGAAYWMVVENNAGVVGGGMYWGYGGNASSSYVANPTAAARFNYYTTPQWGIVTPPAFGMQVSAIPAPLANAQSITPTEDTTYTGSLTGSSANSNKLNYAIVAGATKGTVTITNPATGAFSYIPNANATGLDSFTFKVNDGILDSAVATISVNITPVNDTPVANAQTITLNEDSTFSGSLGASDVDGNGLTYLLVSQGAKGTVTLNSSTGAFSYVPNANANGSDSFTFKVNDGVVDSVTATVTVNITPVNDSPVTSSSSVTLASIVEDSVNPSGATVQSLFGSLFSDTADNQRQSAVTETFLSSTGGWTNGVIDSNSSQAWGSFLGRYGMNSEISKTFATGGNATTISFEFMRIDSWDGESFRLYANNSLIIEQPLFCNQQITSTLSGSVSGYTWTMTPVDYGYKSNAGWDDQKFLVTLNVPSGVASLTLRLNSTLNQGADDESWGIDNFNSGIPIGDGSIANTFAGVAISNYTVDASKGQWQYSTDASNWSNLPTTTASSAVTLRPADYLRFLPAANYNGQATALSANLIESGGSAITSGAVVNLSGVGSQLVLGSGNVIGWSSIYDTRFSADNIVDEQSGPIVTDNFGDNYWLASDGTGTSSILIDLGVATPLSKIELYNTTNAWHNDRGTSNFHIEVANAISGNSATTYSMVNGLTVASGTMAAATVGVAPTAQTFSLSSGSMAYRYVRFVVDSSRNNNPGLHELRLFGTATGVGGTTLYSQQTVSVNHAIIPVNDAPRLTSSTVTLASVLEDVGNAAPGARVSDLFIYVMDDSLDNGVASLAGIAISSYTVDTSKGNWQYSTDSSTWSNLSSATSSAAITLRATDYLRFVPAANYNGQATSLSANIIETGGAAITSGAVVNLSNAIGGATVYSQQTVSVNHTITSVNDAPVIGGIDAVVNYISTDFTTAPANSTLSGSAAISNGECVLTPAIGGQNGYLLFNTLPSNPTSFSAQFDYRVADGSGADGTSFNYGPINGLGNLYEYGITNSGLVVSFIEYGSQRVEVKFNGALLQSSNFTLLNPNYQRIIVNVDGSNKFSLSIGGVPVVSNLDLGSAYGNANKASWQFGFASRTGGATNKHSVDNLNISSVIAPVEALEQSPTILNGGLTLTDLDNPTLASATVSISNGFRNNEDVLGFVSNTQNYGNIAGTFSTSTGVLALTSAGATATLAQWQAALRSVTYTNTSDTPNTSNRVVSFVVNDGISDSTASTVTLKVTPLNDAPVANAQTITTNEDTTYTGALSGSDVEGSALTYSVVTQGARGVVTITNPATGAFTYVPSANANGSDSFTFKVNDGSLDSTTGTVTVNITPVNDAPTISSVANLTGANVNTPFEITYDEIADVANESDKEGDVISFRVESINTDTVVLTKNGSAVIAGTTTISQGEKLVWTPVSNTSGLLNAFTIKAWDGLLASASSVQVKVQVNARNVVNVNSLSDSNLAGKTNLRQAITQANSFAGDTSIVFDESLFASPQTIILGSVITIGNSLVGIVSIEGPSNGNLRISGNNSVGLFIVNSESRFKNLT
ncbi:MAG: tandem-95 repeat protein, partial [Gemmataceae bacterium]